MSTTCPNCNHSVRKDARYCGYCGADLNPPVMPPPVIVPARAEKSPASQNLKTQIAAKPKRFQTSQVVTMVAIFLLFLVVILAIVCRYWSDISQELMQLLFTAYLRLVTL